MCVPNPFVLLNFLSWVLHFDSSLRWLNMSWKKNFFSRRDMRVYFLRLTCLKLSLCWPLRWKQIGWTGNSWASLFPIKILKKKRSFHFLLVYGAIKQFKVNLFFSSWMLQRHILVFEISQSFPKISLCSLSIATNSWTIHISLTIRCEDV